MICIRAFTAADADRIVPQPRQLGDGPVDVALAENGPAVAIEDGGGRLLMIGGLTEVHRGHAVAWSTLTDAKGAAFLAMTRATRAVIAGAGYRRVSTLVRDDDVAAHRWARLIGLNWEGRMTAYGEDGADYAVYARIDQDGAR